MPKKWVDRIATPRRSCVGVENISELLCDSSKINMMRLLNCDEKYKKEWAPDCELLMEWERLLPLCKGSGVAALYEAEKKWLRVEGMDFFDRWNLGGNLLRVMDLSVYELPKNQIHIHEFVTDFINKNNNAKASLSDLSEEMKKRMKANRSKEFHLILELPDAPFLRPNLYAAEQAFSKAICNEKYKDEEWGLILTQLVISLAKCVQNEKKIVLHLYSPYTYAPVFDTLSYLLDHRLFSGKIMMGIFVDTAMRAYEPLCRFFKEKPDQAPYELATEVILTVPDFAEGLDDRLRTLFRLYPRGGLTLGGVRTDSPAYFIADELALSAWMRDE